jgi:hypothetical protein
MRVGKRGGEIGIKGRLVVFDGQNGFSVQGISREHEIPLEVQSICGDHPSSHRETGQEQRQIIPLSIFGTRIGDRRKNLVQTQKRFLLSQVLTRSAGEGG